jgi:carboxyl-terminal processing protease
MRRRRRSYSLLLALLLPVALAGGIYLGGHPDTLPGPVRDVLVADSQGRVYDEALDTLQRDYYRDVNRDELLDKSLENAVGSLNDRFSHYFPPRDYEDFQQST